MKRLVGMMFPNEEDIKIIGDAIGNANLSFEDFKPIASSGLTHEHIVIANGDYILRVPRKNQLGKEPLDYLYHQKFCYDVAEQSGVTPKCRAIIHPSEDLPNGALVIERIEGRAVNSAADLPAIAKSLAAMSKIKPEAQIGNILEVVKSPFETILNVNDFFLDTYLDADIIKNEVRNKIAEMRYLTESKVLSLGENFPIGMIGGDSHLGNYMIDKNGKAWFVDLEFLAFDVPALDTADAILDITKQLVPENSAFKVSNSDKDNFYNSYFTNIDNADELKPFVKVAEDLVTLRTLGWMCYWQAEGQFDKNKPPQHICDNYNRICDEFLNVAKINSLFNKENNQLSIKNKFQPN